MTSPKIIIRFFSTLKHVLKKDKLEILLDNQKQILKNVLLFLCEDLGTPFKELIFSRNMEDLNPNILILINDVEITLLDKLETRLTEGDIITIFPSIHGGAF